MKKYRGIRVRLLAYFLGITIVILLVVWLMQIVFLGSYYRTMKRGEVERLGARIASDYGSEDYSQYVADVAFQNELKVLVFRVAGSSAEIINSGGYGDGMFQPMQQINELNIFLQQLGGNKKVSYISDNRKDFETLTYGEVMQVDGDNIYFYVSASLVPVESTTAVLNSQLIIVTAICLVIAALTAIYLSLRLSKPLMNIAGGCEKLAKGDFSVSFSEKGYTEVEKLSQTLNYATKELGKTDSLRRELIANVSHELRTPLTMIKGYAELILDINGDNKAKREENLKTILEETDRLKNLVSDMLDMSKLQSGVTAFDKQIINLSETIKSAIKNFESAYGKEGYEFISDIEPDCIITADERRMYQVAYNLLSNAVNYSTDKKQIVVNLKKNQGHIRLDVIDSGVGIDSDDLPYIFEKYFRSEAVSQNISGSGVGLSLVKNILDAHGYQCGVDSRKGHGSDFYVTFGICGEISG